MAVVWKISVLFLSVICVSHSVTCPPLWSKYGSKCYRFFGQRKSWHDAEKHCRGFFNSDSQGHLATIRDSSTNDLLLEMWKTSLISIQSEGDRVWIGLNDQVAEGAYRWISEGTQSIRWGQRPPDVWLPGQPDGGEGEHCVDFWNNSGKIGWNDENCARENAFICMMGVGSD
ncbi:alpha-N-acetylgalactosamine-specific lectin-like [Asterias rubens]|uniref:alpha-N-acetylgalactosamine-specific lectin-like n=1 Tax=Asterias rubens TaxID=7604 RepID=UPI001455A423|nr:alpha-N-acetylgalactosamine-specific lectin-like [Asterias rubens]